jgi:hypothetical protein
LYTLHRYKIITAFALLFWGVQTWAQPNLEQYDNKRIHFGFSLHTNIGRLRIDRRTERFPFDTLKSVSATSFPGIGLGALTNLHLGNNWDIRMMFPVISFVQRNVVYQFENVKREAQIESAYCDLSLLVKFKSDRRKNVRVYVIGGFRASYDWATTINQDRSLNKPVVSLVPFTTGYEAGFGLDVYFPYFKFSPEIKFCNTFGSALFHDGYIYTEALNGIAPQLIQISLHFEG